MMNIIFHSRWHIDKFLLLHLIHRYAVPLPHRGRLLLAVGAGRHNPGIAGLDAYGADLAAPHHLHSS